MRTSLINRVMVSDRSEQLLGTIRDTMPYSLKQAAEATGKSKQTIHRAIQAHKISAKKDIHGEWHIDPAELHRVYDPVTVNIISDAHDHHVSSHDSMGLVRELNHLREMIMERDKRITDKEMVILDKDVVIGDLRERLNRENEERRRAHAQLTALLTDQRTEKVAVPVRHWWFPWR